MVKRISQESGSKDIDAYIAGCPKDIQAKLNEIRAAIREAAPGATETMSYFHMPGYFYPGYDYNGMFAWFGLQKSYIALLLRPPVVQDHQDELSGYHTTKAAIHLPLYERIPVPLVKNLVKASVNVMKEKPRALASPKPRARRPTKSA
ncbi:MAG: DUF1801 domain-containing protein [Nitrososphaerota archaeon]|nr:DUF1801 domain-containing protein [Nitrososphaerota archaeon]